MSNPVTYMPIDCAVLWSQNIKVVTTGKIAQIWNSSAEFWTCYLTDEKNFKAVVMDYISIRSYIVW